MTSPMAWHTLSGFRRDRSVARRKLAPGTVRRIARFAAPYKRWLGVFLVLILFDAVITVLNPLILKQIIDKGVAPGAPNGDPALVVRLALLVAALAVVDAGINLVQRWYSARDRRGAHLRHALQGFDHVQRMPIAFFTRTQTGALDQPAQQRRARGPAGLHGHAVQRRQQPADRCSLVIAAMLTLSWQITLVSLVLLPVFLIPARMLGARLQQMTREGYGLDAADEHDDDGAVQRRGRAAGQAVRPARARRPRRSGTSAGRVRDIGVDRPCTAGSSSWRSRWSRPWPRRSPTGSAACWPPGAPWQIGTLVALTVYLARLYGPLTALSNVRVDVMTALVSFERVFEVLDLPPAIADKPGRRRVAAHGRHHRVRRRRLPLSLRRGGLAGLPGIGGRPRQDRFPSRCCTG